MDCKHVSWPSLLCWNNLYGKQIRSTNNNGTCRLFTDLYSVSLSSPQMTQWTLRLCWEKWHRLVSPRTTSTLLPFRWRDTPTWSLDVPCVRSPGSRNSLIRSQQNEARMLISLFCCFARLIRPWALMFCYDINTKVIWLWRKCLLWWRSQRNIYIEPKCRNERQACSWFEFF